LFTKPYQGRCDRCHRIGTYRQVGTRHDFYRFCFVLTFLRLSQPISHDNMGRGETVQFWQRAQKYVVTALVVPCRWRETMFLNVGHQRAYCSSPRRYVSIDSRDWMTVTGEIRRTLIKPCSGATLSTTNSTSGGETEPMRWENKLFIFTSPLQEIRWRNIGVCCSELRAGSLKPPACKQTVI
jgi:hypothetical protein